MSRRTIALIALLATSWPHVVVLECVLGSTTQPGESGHHAMPSSEAAPPMDHAPASHEHAAGASGDTGAPVGQQCAMVMACGLVMIQGGDGSAMAELAGPTAPGPLVSIVAPQASVVVGDPPPPRRNA